VQLVVTATRVEQAALLRLLPPEPGPDPQGEAAERADDGARPAHHPPVQSRRGLLVAIGGVGIAAAAACAAALAAQRSVSAVWSIGVAGGVGLPVGALAVAQTVTLADGGVEQADGSVRSLQASGWGTTSAAVPRPALEKVTARLPTACLAHALTVGTVSGTSERAAAVRARSPGPGPCVEDMEAWGVFVAAHAAGLPFFAVKAVSNPVGPRDEAAWNLPLALNALAAASAALFTDPPDWT
jgi:futalosine hydrolase